MTEFKFTTKTVFLRQDAKDIKIEYLSNKGDNLIKTYISYVSESHPHKHCLYIVNGKWKLGDNDLIINGVLNLIELM